MKASWVGSYKSVKVTKYANTIKILFLGKPMAFSLKMSLPDLNYSVSLFHFQHL